MAIVSQSDTRTSPTSVSGAAQTLRRLRWNALGTDCEVQYTCTDEAKARAFETEVSRWVTAFEAKYSRFRPDSLISRINAAAGGDWVEVDAETEEFFGVCDGLHQLSRGLLDVTVLPLLRLWDYRSARPRVPTDNEIADARKLVGWPKVQRAPRRVRLPERGMAIDLGGWGKEYAVDMVAQLARNFGISQALVDFGHDLHAVGAAPGKPGWHIGIEDPARPGAACWGSIAVRDRGVASSGDYLRGFTAGGRRYGHIIDPRTGRPVDNGCRQVTVVARGCLQAGALSTVVFMLGAQAGIKFVEEINGAEAVVVTDHARHQTKGFNRHVVAP